MYSIAVLLNIVSRLIIALSLTLMIEFPIVSLFFRKCSLYRNNFKDSFKVFVYTNIATNVPLNAFLVLFFGLFGGTSLGIWNQYFIIAVLEIIVVAVEGCVYHQFFKCGKPRCDIASVVANIVSFGLGLFILYVTGIARY